MVYNVSMMNFKTCWTLNQELEPDPLPGGCYLNTWLTGLAKQLHFTKGYKHENQNALHREAETGRLRKQKGSSD